MAVDKWHGKLAKDYWALLIRSVTCNEKARPEYTDCEAHEYRENLAVFVEKIDILAQLILQSTNCIAYTGAGLTVSSGLADYATKADASETGRKEIDDYSQAKPNIGHCALVALQRKGYVKKCFQQNHDGLLQKAGFPQHAINEIHGASYDPSNPGGFDLRADLFNDLIEWEQKADLCLALGTSLSGLNADRVARTPAQKCLGQNLGLGLIIVALQETQLDEQATLRIFAPLDDVLQALAHRLELEVRKFPKDQALSNTPNDIYTNLPYDLNGKFSAYSSMTLNLQKGARVRVCGGSLAGYEGVIGDKTDDGHHNVHINVPIGDPHENTSYVHDHLLGSWWLEEARGGLISQLPIVQV